MEHTKAAEEQRVTQVLLRSHVERCLQDIWDVPDLVIDDDGDYPYRRGTAMCWVSPFDGPVPGVRVFAHAAYGLKPSAKLLREVNDLNVRSVWARVALLNGVVRVSAELHWAAVDRLALEQAARGVGEVADDIGALLATVYGGHTPFPVEVTGQDEAQEGRAA
jgi:hypothetical protein